MKNFLSLFCLIVILKSTAQDNIPTYYGASVVPPSPTSASLGKYGDVPVSLYTGIPQISIPLYTLKEGNLSLPISLSYHSQGFKVEDMASWVGLGWSLNAGGTITRAVKGVPDEFTSGFGTDVDFGGGIALPSGYGSSFAGGYLYSGNLVEDMYNSNMTNSNAAYYAPYLAYNGLDGEPDVFYFNFPGGSGQFVFDKNGNLNFLSQQNIKITYTRSSTTGPIIKFEITDGNGNIYTFDEVEQTKTISYSSSETYILPQAEDLQFNYGGWSTNNFMPIFNSSWHLTKIKNATNNHEINLTYTQENHQYYSGFSTQYRLWELFTNQAFTDKSWNTMAISAKRLNSISCNNGTVVFNATVNRDDMNGINAWSSASPPTYPYTVPAGNAMALSSIEIKTPTLNLVKKYNFNYSYFLATNVASAGVNASMYKKLKLVSLAEQSSDLVSTNPPYQFEYDETVAIAPRFSLRQDFWGFLKATAAPSNLYTPLTYDYPNDPIDNDFLSEFSYFHRTSNNSSETIYGNYDKSPEASSLKSCIIKKITYPTKGTTSFEFEPHDFILQNTTRIGGGLRIKTITDYDGIDHAKDIIKNYSYKQSAAPTLSSGKALTLTIFAKRAWCSSILSRPISLFMNSIAPLGSTMGSFVGYSEVTVEFNGNGKTLSKFHLPATVGVDQEDCISAGNCIYNRTKANLSFGYWGSGGNTACLKDNFPYADNPNYDWHRGAILEEYVYDNLNRLVKKTVNSYTIKDYKKIPAVKSALLTKNTRGIPPLNGMDYWFYFKNATYYYISAWKVLTQQTVTEYDVNNPSALITNSSNYYYDNPNHKQLTKTIVSDSKGINYETSLKRCLDFVPTTGFLSTLNSQNRLNEVIEQQQWVYDYGTTTKRLLGASFTEYKDFSTQNSLPTSQLLPVKSYNLETASPILESAFVPTTFSGSTFNIDTRFKPSNELNFDNKDNLIKKSIFNAGLKNNSTNIFGHNKTLLIAQVNNANEADCGFTSFESDDQNLWTINTPVTLITNDGHCGTQSRLIPPNTFGPTRNFVPSTDAQNKKFILSCWIKTNSSATGSIGSLVLTSVNPITGAMYPSVSGSYMVTTLNNTNNTWQYIEVEIDLKQIKNTAGLPLSTTLGIGSFIWNQNATVNIQVDDIRFYPKEARMSTFTYIPAVGASSVSDENSNCQFYEYDTFGRLKIVKDQFGRIIEKTDYNYKP